MISSPSSPTHAAVTCGPPSLSSVTTCATASLSRSALPRWGSGSRPRIDAIDWSLRVPRSPAVPAAFNYDCANPDPAFTRQSGP